MNLLSRKTGDEMFELLKKILGDKGITVYHENGSVKDLYTLSCEFAKAINKY